MVFVYNSQTIPIYDIFLFIYLCFTIYNYTHCLFFSSSFDFKIAIANLFKNKSKSSEHKYTNTHKFVLTFTLFNYNCFTITKYIIQFIEYFARNYFSIVNRTSSISRLGLAKIIISILLISKLSYFVCERAL